MTRAIFYLSKNTFVTQNLLKNLWKKARGDIFFMSSAVLFIGSLFVGVANYLYQFLMARMLPVAAYGELQSLLALLSIITVFSSAISLVVTKYTAGFTAQNNFNKIYSLLVLFSKKIFVITGFCYLIFVLLSGHIANFLNLNVALPVVLLGISFVFGFSNSITWGILRGMQKFKEFSVLSLIQAFLKIIFSVVLVKLGFEVNGAVGAVVLSSVLGYFACFYPIRFLFKQKIESIEGKKIFQYSFPVFFTLLSTTLLWSMDIIMVKHFFSAQVAGEYAALAMIGRIIFFITGPISSVMFPMAADAHAASRFPAKVLKKAIVLVSAIGGAIVLGYFLLPDLVIRLLVGVKFIGIRPYLGWYALAMFLYSLVSLFSNYFLSVGEVKSAYIVVVGAVLQMICLLLFHESIGQIIWVVSVVMLCTLMLLLGYFVKMYYLKRFLWIKK